MVRSLTMLSCAAMLVCPAISLADCPSGLPNEIFCDSFDTYCTNGGYPGSPDCASGSTKDNTRLQTVWRTTSIDETTGNTCGTQFIVDDNPVYLSSSPFGGRHPCLTNDAIGQQSVSNWNVDPSTPGIGFLIQNTFPGFDTVTATNTTPLILEFYLSGVNKPEWDAGGGLSRSTAYMELALGDDRANTDYVFSPYCGSYCNPPIGLGPFPVVCAVGNPESGLPLPVTCPSRETAPLHAAVAVGTMPMLDPNPCHCGVVEHGPINIHLTLFDGQLWWNLRNNSPVASGGTVTPEDPNAPMPPPGDLNNPGNFQLMAGKPNGSGPPNQWVKLTIYTSSFDIQMTARELSASNGYIYRVTSVMNGIPRKYLGCFDQLRGGLGTGCTLADASSWTDNCAGDGRKCIVTFKNNANAVIFDDVVLHGGAGCSLLGACCNTDNTCAEVEQADCAGIFHGTSTHCNEVVCCPVIHGDADKNGSVDMVDFGMLQACVTRGGTATTMACECFDFNSDNAVNSMDVEHFILCANGSTVPGDSIPPCRGVGL